MNLAQQEIGRTNSEKWNRVSIYEKLPINQWSTSHSVKVKLWLHRAGITLKLLILYHQWVHAAMMTMFERAAKEAEFSSIQYSHDLINQSMECLWNNYGAGGSTKWKLHFMFLWVTIFKLWSE